MNNIALNKLATLFVIIGGIILIYYLSIKMFFLFLPFIIGYFISKLVAPIVYFLHEKLKIPNNLATVIMTLMLISVIGYLIYLVAQGLIIGIGELSRVLPGWSKAITEYGETLSIKIGDMSTQLPFSPATIISKGLASVFSMISESAGMIANKGISLASSLPTALISIVITILSAFFFTKDRKMIAQLFAPYYDKFIGSNVYFQSFKTDILFIIWGYIKAQLTLMSITFTISAIGLMIIGVDKPIIFALGIGLVDMLPMFGPASFYIPWMISLLVGGQIALVIKLFFLYLTTTLTRQMLEPRILGGHIGVHPLLTLLGLYLGVKLLGIPGIILGPFTMVILVASYKRYYLNKENHETKTTIN